MSLSNGRLGLEDPVRAPATRAVPLPRAAAPPRGDADLPRYLRELTHLADRDGLEAAHAGCAVAMAEARRCADPSALAAAHSLRASVARRRGDLRAAGHDATTAADLLDAAGAGDREDAAMLLLARRLAVLLDIGDVATAETLIDRSGGAPDDSPSALTLRYARGLLHAAAGRPGEGVSELFACGERLGARGTDHPLVLPWRSAAARILAGIGAAEAASRLVDEEIALIRRGGTRSALGRALRIRAMVRTGSDALTLLDESVRLLAATPRRFEYAQVLVDQAVLLTAARRRPQARRQLREGLALARRCGSPALEERARTAYAAAGGKPRPA
ncbi:hypothetical protein [Mangrovihabitans endophyticus]|uniref:Tetratricopeptide repeat-containing protein n=1 Tax=Mangrovihabitans endophyticus TaxID=1751298 RepID=A0A8J3BVA7_9ACTN|nr:hypothetical protein [Mangrovihabitans endophyticus]GGK80736.1 hypothetical protein GCM10012284_13340 [Mangrovihabitans endophyticus]